MIDAIEADARPPYFVHFGVDVIGVVDRLVTEP